MALFCTATVVFLVWRDCTIPAVRDVEVWFGFEVRGVAAWLSAPLHWSIFALGAWGYWKGRAWVWPWAAVYAFYVAASHLVWSGTSASGGGWGEGLLLAALFSLPGWGLLWLRPPDAALQPAPASRISRIPR